METKGNKKDLWKKKKGRVGFKATQSMKNYVKRWEKLSEKWEEVLI